MSENKAPNAVVVSAQRLQDLRDLCQPSNFNTTEQAHSALHNGISKLLNEQTGFMISIKRLMLNDQFKFTSSSEEVWVVRNKVRDLSMSFTTSECTGQAFSESVKVSHERIMIITEDELKRGSIDLATGKVSDKAGMQLIDIDFATHVYLISQL